MHVVDLSGAISQMIILLLIAGVGYVAGKLDFLDQYMVGKLSRLLLNITLPCMILASVSDLGAQGDPAQIGWAFALSALQFVLLLASGALCNLLLRTPREDRGMYLFMSICTNNGFLGIPVVTAIYGDQTVVLSSIFMMVLAIFIYSVGFGILARGSGEQAKIPWKSMINPSMVACLIAIGIFFASIHLPPIIEDTMSMLGGITSPIAMLIVGVLMAGAKLKEVVSEWRMYPYILIRQLIVPVGLFFLLRIFVPDATLIGVFIVMFAMPVGSMASTFAAQFNQNAQLAAKGTVLSTIASFAIIPVLVAVMTSF